MCCLPHRLCPSPLLLHNTCWSFCTTVSTLPFLKSIFKLFLECCLLLQALEPPPPSRVYLISHSLHLRAKRCGVLALLFLIVISSTLLPTSYTTLHHRHSCLLLCCPLSSPCQLPAPMHWKLELQPPLLHSTSCQYPRQMEGPMSTL